MGARKKSRIWWVVYVICYLAYVPWVAYLSLNDFDMVHSQYRRIGERLQPVRIAEIALQELVDQCRKEAKRSGRTRSTGDKAVAAAEGACLSWPADVLVERQKVVAGRLDAERSRAVRKLVLFYVSFVGFFLTLPAVILYLLMSLFVWVVRNIKGLE